MRNPFLCPKMMSRRQLLGTAVAAGGALALPKWMHGAAAAPASPVAVAKCASYNPAELVPAMRKMFDQIGGLERIVRNKTVAMKVNLTGPPSQRVGYAPSELTHYTHPAVIGAAIHLMGRAGAKRIRVLEGAFGSWDPLEEFMMEAGWNIQDMAGAATTVEFENTNVANGRKYVRFKAPNGGLVYSGYDLNASYSECDVLVSIPKMKEHVTAGVTLSMKNMFGAAPISIYGDGAGKDEPNEQPRGGRNMFHMATRQPSASAPPENANTPRDQHLRVPRVVADICAARPIDLAIIDGIVTMNRGEGPWIPGCVLVKPGLLVAGTNPVCTDTVATALMGFDPGTDKGLGRIAGAENTMKLAEAYGLGTRDLKRIEVVGAPIAGNVFRFEAAKAQA